METVTAAWVQRAHLGHCESDKPVEEKVLRGGRNGMVKPNHEWLRRPSKQFWILSYKQWRDWQFMNRRMTWATRYFPYIKVAGACRGKLEVRRPARGLVGISRWEGARTRPGNTCQDKKGKAAMPATPPRKIRQCLGSGAMCREREEGERAASAKVLPWSLLRSLLLKKHNPWASRDSNLGLPYDFHVSGQQGDFKGQPLAFSSQLSSGQTQSWWVSAIDVAVPSFKLDTNLRYLPSALHESTFQQFTNVVTNMRFGHWRSLLSNIRVFGSKVL